MFFNFDLTDGQKNSHLRVVRKGPDSVAVIYYGFIVFSQHGEEVRIDVGDKDLKTTRMVINRALKCVDSLYHLKQWRTPSGYKTVLSLTHTYWRKLLGSGLTFNPLKLPEEFTQDELNRYNLKLKMLQNGEKIG